MLTNTEVEGRKNWRALYFGLSNTRATTNAQESFLANFHVISRFYLEFNPVIRSFEGCLYRFRRSF